MPFMDAGDGATSGGQVMAKRPKVMQGESARPDLFGNKALPFLDTQTIYCGDNLDKLRQTPDACVDLIYTIDAEKECRAFFLRTGKEIVPVKVSQILAGDIPIRLM